MLVADIEVAYHKSLRIKLESAEFLRIDGVWHERSIVVENEWTKTSQNTAILLQFIAANYEAPD